MAPYLTLHSSLDRSSKRTRRFSVQSLVGTEVLCDDFSFLIKVSSLEKLIEEELTGLCGDSVTLNIAFADKRGSEGKRSLNGIVYHVKELGMSRAPLVPDLWRYELEIGSWMRQLAFVSDCRIIQKNGNTSIKIVSELLRELGFRDVRDNTSKESARKDYAVIYNETLLNFIKRSLYDAGVTWYFEHSEKRHTLVLVDDTAKLPRLSSEDWGAQDRITSFFRESNHTPLTHFQLSAYDWENPPVKNIRKKLEKRDLELSDFQYPAGFIQRKEGEKLAERTKLAIKSNKTSYHGTSNIRMFAVGHCFDLEAATLPELDAKPFLIHSLTIEASSETYTNRFHTYNAREPFHLSQPNDFHRPLIKGTQTAFVVGEAGAGKIHTDKMGRIKVRFHWDHHNPQSSSKPYGFVRVAGPCAGSQRGFLFTPRIGEEVTVCYEDGNPEKPLITGSVYSNSRKPPASANAKPCKSFIKTGSESDANYVTFNDTPGSENLEINAKKDLNITVGRDLDIEVEDDVNIQAKKVNVIIRKNIQLHAGGSIVNLSLKSINNTAGADINKMALGGIINMAGGIVTNLAGCSLTNTAILSVENTSANGIQGKADTLYANTALNAVGHMGPTVENEASLAMSNISKGGIINDAKNVKTETLFQKVKVRENSITETDGFNIKGLMSKLESPG